MPEVKGSVGAVLFWGWLAGTRKSARSDLLLSTTCGLGITQNMAAMAKILVDLWHQQRIVEGKMLELLKHPQFDRDRAVMQKYYLSNIAQAIIISQYYPLANFLGEDGKEIMQLAGSRRTLTKTLKPIDRPPPLS